MKLQRLESRVSFLSTHLEYLILKQLQSTICSWHAIESLQLSVCYAAEEEYEAGV